MKCQSLSKVRGHPCRRATLHRMSGPEEDEEECTQGKFGYEDSEKEQSEECFPEEDNLMGDLRG